MTEKFQGIVLDTVRHNDRHNIVTLYTRQRGRVAFLSPAGSGPGAKLRQARLMPLSIIEGDFNFRPQSELQKLGAFSLSGVWAGIHSNPVKQLMAMFLSEFLNKLLRASMPDPLLWDYIAESVSLLDGIGEGLHDFHIVFLASLLPFAGIQPDASQWEKGMVLDMQNGTFTRRIPAHKDWIDEEEAAFAASLCRIDFSKIRALRLSSSTRMKALEGLLRYYSLHFPGTGNLKSLQVIHEIFHS